MEHGKCTTNSLVPTGQERMIAEHDFANTSVLSKYHNDDPNNEILTYPDQIRFEPPDPVLKRS